MNASKAPGSPRRAASARRLSSSTPGIIRAGRCARVRETGRAASRLPGMDCETAREAVSAVMDGEVPGSPVADLQEHLAGCAACRVWREAAHEVTRRARIAPAAAAPQRTGEVLAALRARARLPRRRLVTVAVVRAGLAVVAAAQ